MRWLDRGQRHDVDRAAAHDLLVKDNADVATAEPPFLDRDALDYLELEAARGGRIRRLLFRYSTTFFVFVALPAVALACYYAFIAADQYVVQSRFVVRQMEDTSFSENTMKLDSAQENSGGGDKDDKVATTAGESRASAGGSRNTSMTVDNEDAYVVASYIGSGAIVDRVSQDLNLRAVFSRPEADFWMRLDHGATQEDLERFWLRMVDVYVDPPSGIVTLTVRAFHREDAVMLSNDIITASSRLVNEMSMRARADALARAKSEVERSEKLLQTVMADLQKFRNREGLIDPTNVAADTSDLLKTLLGQRIATDTELEVTLRTRPNAPSIPATQAKLRALDSRISELRSTLTAKAGNARTIATTLVGYDDLLVKEQLAKDLYIDARVDEESARQSAEKRWLYLAVFVPPALPDDAEYPKRIGYTILGVGVLFGLWSIGALIWASIQDHRP